jgi:hypothetical protein
LKTIRSNAENIQEKVNAQLECISELNLNDKVINLESILRVAAEYCKQERRHKNVWISYIVLLYAREAWTLDSEEEGHVKSEWI